MFQLAVEKVEQAEFTEESIPLVVAQKVDGTEITEQDDSLVLFQLAVEKVEQEDSLPLVVAQKVDGTEITEQDDSPVLRTNVSYIRGLFPKKYFKDRNVAALELKFNKRMMPMVAESRPPIDWMVTESGIVLPPQGVVLAPDYRFLRNLYLYLEANPSAIEESVEGRIVVGDDRIYGFEPLEGYSVVAMVLRGIEPPGDRIPLVNLSTSLLVSIDFMRVYYGEATVSAVQVSSRRSTFVLRSQLRERDFAGFMRLIKQQLAGLGVEEEPPCQVTLYGRREATTFVPLTVNGGVYGHWFNRAVNWQAAREEVAMIGYHTADMDF